MIRFTICLLNKVRNFAINRSRKLDWGDNSHILVQICYWKRRLFLQKSLNIGVSAFLYTAVFVLVFFFLSNICVIKTWLYIKNEVCTNMSWGCLGPKQMLKINKIVLNDYPSKQSASGIRNIVSIGFMCLLSITSTRTSNYRFENLWKHRARWYIIS